MIEQHPVLSGTKSVLVMTPDEPMFPATHAGHGAFQAAVRDMGLKHEPTHGQYDKPEKSYIVYGATKQQAQQLGSAFGQESVLFSEKGKPEIHYTNGPNKGLSHPYKPEDNRTWNETPNEKYWTYFPGHGYARLGFDWSKLV